MVSDRAAQHPDNTDCLYPDNTCLYPDPPGPGFRIILPTTKRFYYWELDPFFSLFNHYWGPDQEVVVMGDGDPGLDYPNLVYFDMPLEFRIDGLWIMHFFSSGIRWYLKEHMAEDHFIMLQTDFWLTAPPNLDGLRAVKRYMEANPDVIRVGICPWPGSADSPYLEPEGEQDGITFYHCKWKKRDCFLQMSNIPAMWNRHRLYEVWKDGWDGWACEGWGGDRLLKEFPQYRSVIAKPPVFFWNHVSYSRPGFERVCLSQLPEEGQEIVRPFVPAHFEVR